MPHCHRRQCPCVETGSYTGSFFKGGSTFLKLNDKGRAPDRHDSDPAPGEWPDQEFQFECFVPLSQAPSLCLQEHFGSCGIVKLSIHSLSD